MEQETTHRWKFLTNHAQVLACIAHDPGVLLREISERVGITERAAHRIVTELAAGGYITRERNGRRNRYTIQTGLPLPDRLGRVQRISDLLTILIGTSEELPHSPVRPAAKNGKASRV
ncbi:MAG: AsnC family transcriptional regulator [Solirubrobacterales bacterium]|jgi:DNA-binding Lrp family transcriptional regulator|nr:AsnC family transcriptional regulator [Solirubrobacterales bacterium]